METSSAIEKTISTSVIKLTCKDGKTGLPSVVPRDFELCHICITTSLPALKGPYFVDILLDDDAVYASVPIVASSSPVLDLPAPVSTQVRLRMERVSGVVTGADAYATMNFYNWSEHIEFPKSIRTIVENVPEVKIHGNAPIRTELVGDVHAKILNTPLSVHEVSDKIHKVEIAQTAPIETTLKQPVWVTSQPLFESRLGVEEIYIPFCIEVERCIANSQPLVAGRYTMSKVAYRMSENGDTDYSVNFTYDSELPMTVEALAYHKRILRNLHENLLLKHIEIVYLQIDNTVVTKLQVVYDYIDTSIIAEPEGDQVYVTPYGTIYTKVAWPEMDKTPHLEQESITSGQVVDSSSNVVLAETQEESYDVASKPYNPVWHSLASTEVKSQYNELCDRMLFWKSFEWKTTDQPANKTLLKATLPLDFVNQESSYCAKPNFIPFNVHAYWRGDMQIKIQINSNQFQSGMLIASWLYASDSYGRDDEAGPRYFNVALAMQRPHVLIQAGASNEATLDIPYRYVMPYMRTKNYYKDTPAKMKALNMGTLTICPVVPLMTGTDAKSPTSCNVSVFIALKQSKFTGMVDGRLADPEMESVGRVVGATLGAISRELGDVNCDNPPSTRPASFFVPINAQSWSHGTNTYEPINTLRLNGGRIGVGRSADIGYSDTQIKKITGVYGLLNPVQWSYTDTSTNIPGYLIWGMNAHPQCDKDRMYKNEQVGAMDAYTLPPCSVISSLYCYWRGSLKFKFEIVCTSKHTGRLLIAYVPGIADYTKVTIDQAKSSAYAVFSLNTGTNSFTFDVPYIAETIWWQRKYGGAQRSSDFLAPSSIVMYVVNPLVPMESVPQMVTILPMVAGGDDFEVAVPGQPSIGLALNRTNAVPDSAKLRFKSGYYPVYVGEWHSFISGQKVIFRYGSVSDHVAQTTKPTTPPTGSATYYTPDTSATRLFVTSIDGGTDDLTGIVVKPIPRGNRRVGYAVPFNYEGYDYLIPFPFTTDGAGEDAAKVVAAAVAAKKDLRNYTKFLGNWFENSDYIADGNINWTPHTFPIRSTYNVEPEMDRMASITREESPNVLSPTSMLPTTRDGVVTYGERFYDLKDLCRRYQLYWEGTVAPGQVRQNKRNAAFVQIPILPQGLSLDASLENPVWNSMREGHIPIIASGYRFYRGGVRLRIVVTGLNDSIWVQHHPDRPLLDTKVIIGSNIHDKDAYRNHGYGFHVQNLSVNRTIEVEVPYYRPGVCSLLGDPAKDYDSLYYASLGDVVIGLEGDQPVNDPIDIAIYYTIADDCSFNHFVGFPAMVWCDEVYKKNPAPARAIEQDFEFLAAPEMHRVPEVVALGSSLGTMATSAAASVFGSLLGTAAVKGTAIISKPVVSVIRKEVKDNVTPILQDIEKRVAEAGDEISKSLGRTLPQQAIINALGQFSQVALNPTPSAISVAVASLCAQFVVVSMETIISLQSLLTSFLDKVWFKYFNPSNDPQAGGFRAQPEGFLDEMSDKELHGFLGAVFAAVASTVGVRVAEPGKFPNVMRGVKECLNVCNASVVFFRNIVDSIIYMYRYCLGSTSEELRAKIIIEREYPHMKDWCYEVLHLLDPRNQNVIRHSSRQADRVFDACLYGSKLIMENLDVNVPGGKVVYDLYNKVCKLRDDLIELGNHPDVRFEPFPIWVCGPAGMGKSHMTSRVCKEMLQAINYQTKEMMIYWLALGQKYWNGIGNNPVIARDEAYAVGGQFTEEEIATHLAICSSSILNPPMAALQEKNKRLNPYIYYMNSNSEFPTINEARHPEAIYRRRKLLIRASYTDAILQRFPRLLDASLLSNEDVQDYKHLKFEIANDPKNPNTTWSGPYDFDQMLAIVKENFVRHIQKERENFRQRMRDAYALDPDYDTGDELNYVVQSTLPTETLHEQYLMQREHARHVLYSAPPTLEDESDYMQSIYERFSYLWSDAVVPEGETESSSFYNEAQRNYASVLEERTGLNRASALKLISGINNFSDEDLEVFMMDQEFTEMIRGGVLKMRFSALMSDHYISMLPEKVSSIWKGCSFDDSLVSGGMIFKNSYVPYWGHVSGIDSLRSYVYWLMRQHQYKIITREILAMESKEELLNQLKDAFVRRGQLELWRRLRICSTVEQLQAITEDLEGFSINDVEAVCRVYVLMLFINKTISNNSVLCTHCKFWVTFIHDTSRLEYNARYKTILYYNGLGLRKRMDSFCECQHSLANNILFKNAMRIIWNTDHGTTQDYLNPFAVSMHTGTSQLVDNWLNQLWNFAKDWWQCVASPFISTILTFLYEHFGKIITLLLGLYSIYKLCNGSVVETAVRAGTTLVADTVVGSVVANALNVGEVGLMNAVPQPGGAAPESSSYFKMGTSRAATTHQPAAREGENARSALEVLVSKIANNSCFVTCSWMVKGETYTIKGRCLALRERQILIIKHYLEEFLAKPNDARFMLSYFVNGVASVAFFSRKCLENAKHFHVSGNYNSSNYSVITLDKSLPMFKDITSSLALQSEHHLVKNEGRLIGLDLDSKNMNVSEPLQLRARKYLNIAGDDVVNQIVNDIAYEYSMHGSGLCGAVLVCDNICKGNPGIIGMHVAGCRRSGDGYAEPFYREMFMHVELKPKFTFEPPKLLDPSLSKINLAEKNLIVQGAVEPKYAHRESGKTRIVPSLIQGKVYPVLTEPNPLKANDPRQPPGSNPLIDGCAKHGDGQTRAFDEMKLKQVSEDNRRILFTEVFNPKSEMRLLTEQEAICGSIDIPHCESLNWNSSEGYPLSSERGAAFNNKKYLFDLELTSSGYVVKGIHTKLAAIMRMRQEDRDSKIYRPEIYVDCLKDYRLPFEKCKIPGKTRIFSIAPVGVTIDVRRFMGLFLSGYKSGCIFAQHGIGINPDSYDWTKLALYLREVGDNIVTGDYANFGPSLSSQIVASCLEDIIEWHRLYKAQDWHLDNLGHILFNDILNPWHLCGDLVYQTINGIASGSPITAELNSEVNKKYIKLAFLELVERNGYKYTLYDFNEKVRLVTYGDDFIMSVHNEFISWFNCETIADVLKDYAISLTDAHKGEKIVPYQKLEQSTFLKRTFRRHPTRANVWLAPIEEKSITECINWCHKQANMEAATEEVLRASCELAFGHGPKFYDEHVGKILLAALEQKINFKYPTWTELDLRNFG